MRWALIDTNVYIDFWERGLHTAAVAAAHSAFVVRHSAVVLSELRRGARTQTARKTVESLFRLAIDLWEPLAQDWWEAGKLVRDVGDDKHWDVHQRREFQNDALIALTARRHGATVITSNQADFELLQRRTGIRLITV